MRFRLRWLDREKETLQGKRVLKKGGFEGKTRAVPVLQQARVGREGPPETGWRPGVPFMVGWVVRAVAKELQVRLGCGD